MGVKVRRWPLEPFIGGVYAPLLIYVVNRWLIKCYTRIESSPEHEDDDRCVRRDFRYVPSPSPPYDPEVVVSRLWRSVPVGCWKSFLWCSRSSIETVLTHNWIHSFRRGFPTTLSHSVLLWYVTFTHFGLTSVPDLMGRFSSPLVPTLRLRLLP